MKNFLNQLPLPAKLILIGSIPLVFVAYLTLRLYNEKTQKARLLNSYIERTSQSEDISRLIDHLQAERDFSYEQVLKKERSAGISTRRLSSDSLINKIESRPDLSSFTSFTFLDQLDSVRSKIDKGQYEANQVIHYYTTAIFRLNTLNPVPLGARIYLPEANEDIVSRKLLSEIATYLSITCNNISNALYTRAYVVETLMGTVGTYQIFGSYEKELLLKGSPEVVEEYRALREQPPLKTTLIYLDRTFNTFKLDTTLSYSEWHVVSQKALAQLGKMQENLLHKVQNTVSRIYAKEINEKNQTLILLVLAAVLVLALIIYIIHSINRALNILRNEAERIAEGKKGGGVFIQSDDAIGSLAGSISKIDRNNQKLSEAAEMIGKGKFNTDIKLRSKEDVLGNAIENMKANLQRFTRKLEESEKHGKQLLQALPAAVYTCDAEGYIQMYNQAAVELWGREPIPGIDKWSGSYKMYTPAGVELLPDECPMAITIKEKRKVSDTEIIIERPDGERRFIRPYPEPMYDLEGNLTGAVNMLLDITEQKKSEKDIAWLAALVHSSEDAIVSKTLNGIVTSWNPAAEKLFGYTREEMIGQSITKIIPPDRLSEEAEIISKISRGILVEHFQTLRMTKDHQLIDISLSISPIKNSRGEIIGASKIARDITKAKLAEEQLRQNEKKLNELANAMPQLVWIAEADGRIVYFNNRITEYAGMEKSGDGTWHWVGMMHPDELNATLEEWKKTFATGSLFVREYRFQMAGGKYRWHLTRVTPYKDEQGNITKWIGTATDIDDMKSLVIQKEDFLSVASHELRTPITSIKAYSQLLSHTYRQSNDDFLINALSKLEGQANRMTKLVTDFLKLSKIESGKLQLHKERFLINDLVKEIAADIQFVSLNHKIIIEAPEKANIIGDRERIAQVVTNLLNNAVKYSPGAELVKISIVPNKTHVKVSVTDKGVGIKPEDHSKIFDRFYRASSAVKLPFSGFGIGLYISAEIIRKHGGEIGVSSEEGKGSTFYFTLPQAE